MHICMYVYRLVRHTDVCAYAVAYIFSVKCVQVMETLELSIISVSCDSLLASMTISLQDFLACQK